MKRILHLTLKKKWFNLIASGEKKEEYREDKPYWEKRFSSQGNCFYNDYDEIHFRNGYSKASPFMRVKSGCIFKSYRELFGIKKFVFVIPIKEILEIRK